LKKLECHKPLSTFAFDFNLCRYTEPYAIHSSLSASIEQMKGSGTVKTDVLAAMADGANMDLDFGRGGAGGGSGGGARASLGSGGGSGGSNAAGGGGGGSGTFSGAHDDGDGGGMLSPRVLEMQMNRAG